MCRFIKIMCRFNEVKKINLKCLELYLFFRIREGFVVRNRYVFFYLFMGVYIFLLKF